MSKAYEQIMQGLTEAAAHFRGECPDAIEHTFVNGVKVTPRKSKSRGRINGAGANSHAQPVLHAQSARHLRK